MVFRGSSWVKNTGVGLGFDQTFGGSLKRGMGNSVAKRSPNVCM